MVCEGHFEISLEQMVDWYVAGCIVNNVCQIAIIFPLVSPCYVPFNVDFQMHPKYLRRKYPGTKTKTKHLYPKQTKPQI